MLKYISAAAHHTLATCYTDLENIVLLLKFGIIFAPLSRPTPLASKQPQIILFAHCARAAVL